MVVLKEQIIISIKKKKNVESTESDYRETNQFLAKFPQKQPYFIDCLSAKFTPKIPTKSADFSTNCEKFDFFFATYQEPWYSDETTWHPPENPWKRHFRDSNSQNVPRCLSPQELVPLVQVPKLVTIHCQPACT